MARNRITSANLALFAGDSFEATYGSIQPTQLGRVQSLSYSFDNPKENIQQFGSIGSLGRDSSSVPSVSLNFSYYVTSVNNEDVLGLYFLGDKNILTNVLSGASRKKNYFVFVAPDGADAAGLTGADGRVKGFGNGFITNYNVEGAVGGFPTASVQVGCYNIVGYSDGVSQPSPEIDETTGARTTGADFTILGIYSSNDETEPKVIRPGDISIDLANAGGLFHSLPSGCIQSFSVGVDIAREDSYCLGSRYPKTKDIQFPVNVTFQVEMLANDVVTGDLSQFVCQTGTYSAKISLKNPSCSGNGQEAFGMTLRGLSLESQNWSTQVGGASETVALSYSAQIGGTGDLSNGVFLSGLNYF